MKAGGAEPSESRAMMRAPECLSSLGIGEFGGILGQVQQDNVAALPGRSQSAELRQQDTA